MKIKYQKRGYNNMSGSSLLKQLQNSHTPNLELYIRESVQNSLDAAKPGQEFVSVDIQTGEFQTAQLSQYFEKIETLLNQKYPGTREFLSIADSGTVGLTGPLSLSEIDPKAGSSFGNLQNLIYQTARPQTKEGAGGSWGIGKTVYFRLGIGLVIYYSRVRLENGEFQNRMAATLVEDETQPDGLLSENHQNLGIAWWGEPDLNISDGTMPVTDSNEIRKLLAVFGLTAYEGNQTGTMVIVPFINSGKLLEETVTEGENLNVTGKPFWKNSLDAFIHENIQKWYAPRLDNENYQGPYLKASVNHEQISRDDMYPLFQLIQELYNAANGFPSSFNGREPETTGIRLQATLEKGSNGEIGKLAYLKVTQKDLGMLVPENYPDPYSFIDRDDAKTVQEPIIAYTRKPGMIVSYETDSDWTHSMPKNNGSEYIVGMFSSSRNAVLKKEIQSDHERILTLEDYLRKGEQADHFEWSDVNTNSKKNTIVKRLKNNIKSKIKERFKEEPPVNKERNLTLGRLLGGRLLPPDLNGNWDRKVGGIGGDGGLGGEEPDNPDLPKKGGKSRHTVSRNLKIEQMGAAEYFENKVKIPVLLNFGSHHNGTLSVKVRTENSLMDEKKWSALVGTHFPARIDELKVLDILTIEPGKRGMKKPKSIMKNIVSHPITISKNMQIGEVIFRISGSENGTSIQNINITINEEKYYQIYAEITYSLDNVEGSLDFTDPDKLTGKPER